MGEDNVKLVYRCRACGKRFEGSKFTREGAHTVVATLTKQNDHRLFATHACIPRHDDIVGLGDLIGYTIVLEGED